MISKMELAPSYQLSIYLTPFRCVRDILSLLATSFRGFILEERNESSQVRKLLPDY